MKNLKGLLLAVLAFAGVVLSTPSFAEKTNFSYSTLGIELGKVTYKTPICIGSSCLSELNGVSIGGSYQFADDLLVVSLSGTSMSGSASTWSAEVGGGALALSIVKAVGNKIDITAGIASLSSQVDVCSGSICISESDTGTAYGGGLRIWIDDSKKLAGEISIESSKYSKSTSSTTSTSLGLGYYVTEKDEIKGTYGTNSDASSVSIGYTHHF